MDWKIITGYTGLLQTLQGCMVVFELGNMGKKALNSHLKCTGPSKKVQGQAQVKNVLNSKTKPKTVNQNLTVRFMTIMAIMI